MRIDLEALEEEYEDEPKVQKLHPRHEREGTTTENLVGEHKRRNQRRLNREARKLKEAQSDEETE